MPPFGSPSPARRLPSEIHELLPNLSGKQLGKCENGFHNATKHPTNLCEEAADTSGGEVRGQTRWLRPWDTV